MAVACADAVECKVSILRIRGKTLVTFAFAAVIVLPVLRVNFGVSRAFVSRLLAECAQAFVARPLVITRALDFQLYRT